MATRSSELRILAIAKQNEIIIVYVSQMIARSFRSVLIQVTERAPMRERSCNRVKAGSLLGEGSGGVEAGGQVPSPMVRCF